MIPETSRETSNEQDDGISAETDAPNGNAEPRLWVTLAVLIGVLAVAGSVAALQFLSSAPDAKEKQAAPAQGLACPHLREAADVYDRGDRAAFEEAIARAAGIAEEALQKSGQVFGEPERIALELDLAPRQNSARVERLLEVALQYCQDMGPV